MCVCVCAAVGRCMLTTAQMLLPLPAVGCVGCGKGDCAVVPGVDTAFTAAQKALHGPDAANPPNFLVSHFCFGACLRLLRRFEPRPPTRVGKKKRKKGPAASTKVPTGVSAAVSSCQQCRCLIFSSSFAPVYPTSKCKLRQMKLERIKDFLLMEEEFIRNQDVLKPKIEREQVRRVSGCCWCG